MTDLFSTFGVSLNGELLSVAPIIPLTMVVGFIGLKLRDEMSEAGPLRQMVKTKGGRRMSDLKSQTADGKVLWLAMLSLDGFISGPDDDMRMGLSSMSAQARSPRRLSD